VSSCRPTHTDSLCFSSCLTVVPRVSRTVRRYSQVPISLEVTTCELDTTAHESGGNANPPSSREKAGRHVWRLCVPITSRGSLQSWLEKACEAWAPVRRQTISFTSFGLGSPGLALCHSAASRRQRKRPARLWLGSAPHCQHLSLPFGHSMALPSLHSELACLQDLQDLLQKRLFRYLVCNQRGF
jgi:hypothetical protein